MFIYFFFFNATATTEIYTLSLHDALPICEPVFVQRPGATEEDDGIVLTIVINREGTHSILVALDGSTFEEVADRKSTRLNSSHSQISYAVFCLKKKKKK